MLATATTRAEMEMERAPAIDVVFQMLSSDDEDAATTMGSPVPAAQTLEVASPLSQGLVSPESEVSTAVGGAWVQRRPLGAVAQPLPSRPNRPDESAFHGDATRKLLSETAMRAPMRPKRIDDLFATVAGAVHAVRDSQEEKHEEEKQAPHSVLEVRPPELLLSPASQLHILSQISEMAESRAVRERKASAAAHGATQPCQAARPRHAWAPVASHPQTQPQQTKGARKRKLPTPKAPGAKKSRTGNTLVSAGLLADVATWGGFDEHILEGDDAEEDAWSFEELSDSDF